MEDGLGRAKERHDAEVRAIVQVARPSATPQAVAMPLSSPAESVVRMVSAVSWPGVQMTTAETATNAARLPSTSRSLAPGACWEPDDYSRCEPGTAS